MKFCDCGCGKEFPEKMSNGKTRHFWRGHGNSHKVKASCGHCGKPIKVHQWRRTNFPKVFCNRTCAGKYRFRLETLLCSICGKGVARKPSRFTGNHVICSQACKSQAQRLRTTRLTVYCSQCKAPILIFPSKLKTNKHFYCNSKCRSIHIAGPNNPSFTTGVGRHPVYGANWRKQRRLALKRDNNACQQCKKHISTAKPREIQVHHKKPIGIFKGDWLKGNKLDNLVTLCRACHDIAEKNPV